MPVIFLGTVNGKLLTALKFRSREQLMFNAIKSFFNDAQLYK